MRNTPAGSGSRAVLNALGILESFDGGHAAQTLTQISDRLDLPMATALRNLRALRQGGYVLLDPERKTYSLGPAVLMLSQLFLAQHPAAASTRDALRDIAERTGETAHFGVLQGHEVVYVEIFDSPRRIRATVAQGDRLPAYCVAAGKAILAHSPEETVHSILRAGLPRLTKNTITDAAAFRAELANVRRHGFALNLGEWMEDVAGISAPILAAADRSIGAIGLAGPRSRIRLRDADRLGRVIAEIAARASRPLGG